MNTKAKQSRPQPHREGEKTDPVSLGAQAGPQDSQMTNNEKAKKKMPLLNSRIGHRYLAFKLAS